MNTSEYREVIEAIQRQLRDVGLQGIADTSRLIIEDHDTKERRLLPPADRLIAMLEALDRQRC